LAEQKEMSLVQTAPPSAYIKKGGKVGRPSNAAKIAKTNTKINEFFAPTSDARSPKGSFRTTPPLGSGHEPTDERA
jgi:hypothetical protein